MVLEIESLGQNAEINGFPIILATVKEPDLSGENYAQFNQEIAAFLQEFPQGFVNLIVDASQAPIEHMPDLNDVSKARKTPEYQHITESVRVLLAVGFFQNEIIKQKLFNFLTTFATQLSNVAVKSFTSLDEAYEWLEIPKT